MQMSQSEALSFIGSLLMKMTGVLLVVADSVVIGEPQRAYIMKQREWYEQQQDMMNAAEQVDELMGESESMNDLQAKSTNTLALCPFCGGEAETLTAESMYGGYLFGIMCNDCRSRGDVYDTEAEAIAAWNSRADYHGYEQAAIEAWESIKAWNSRAEHGTMTAELVRAIEDVLRHSTDTVWVGEAETLVDRMVSLGVYKHDVYEGARPWEVDV